jgi:N-acetylglutamate synthase-like GNAT family acetyltransferase
VLALRRATEGDFEYLVDLSIRVMREHLERVGRFDPARRRARMRDHLAAGGLHLVERDGAAIGCVGIEPAEAAVEIHSVFLEPALQGRGLGAKVFALVRAAHPGRAFAIEVLKGSPARRFWERHGFVLVDEKPFDWVMQRPAD